MFDWIKNINKEYPDFWKRYLHTFESKSKRFVVLKTIVTGHNPNKDVILSFGCIGIQNNNIIISDTFEVVLLQYKFLHDNGMSNEFIIESKQPKLGERESIEALIEYVGNAILIGHRIHLDVEMINKVLENMDCGRLKNEALDVEIMHQKLVDDLDRAFSEQELLAYYNIKTADRQLASEEAYDLALLFLKLKSRLKL